MMNQRGSGPLKPPENLRNKIEHLQPTIYDLINSRNVHKKRISSHRQLIDSDTDNSTSRDENHNESQPEESKTSQPQSYQTRITDFLNSTTETTEEGITVLQWNIRSLNDDKIPGLYEIINQHDPDVVLLQEYSASRHPHPKILPGFQFPYITKPNGTKGLATYVKEKLVWQRKPSIGTAENSRSVHQRIQLIKDQNNALTIDNLYIHPNEDKKSRKEIYNKLSQERETFHLILGDLNEEVSPERIDTEMPSFQILIDSGYGNLNDAKHTRIQIVADKVQISNIDGTFASEELLSMITTWTTQQSDISDHLPIFTGINFNCSIVPPVLVIPKTSYPTLRKMMIKYLNESKGGPGEKLLNSLERLKDVEMRCSKSYKICNWWNSELQKLKKARIKARHMKDYPEYHRLRRLFRSEKRKAKARAKQKLLRNIAESKAPWKLIKEAIPGIVKHHNSVPKTDPVDSMIQAEYHANKFEALLTGKTELLSDLRMNLKDHAGLLRIREWEILSSMRTANKKSSPGWDRYTYLHLERLSESPVILHAITQAFREWTRAGLPPQLKRATVIPVPKATPGTYRPISLLSCLAKIYEKVITRRVRNLLEGYIPEYQSGCRRGRSTIDCALKLLHHSSQAQSKSTAENPLHFAVILLDLKKAYDSVDHNLLIRKLSNLGLPTVYLKILSNWLAHRTFTVLVNGIESTLRKATRGLPQGSTLSVLLWQLFTYDFPLQNQEGISNICAFMDDYAIFNSAHSKEALDCALQNSISEISMWCKNNKLVINTEKTHILLNDGDLQMWPIQVKIA